MEALHSLFFFSYCFPFFRITNTKRNSLSYHNYLLERTLDVFYLPHRQSHKQLEFSEPLINKKLTWVELEFWVVLHRDRNFLEIQMCLCVKEKKKRVKTFHPHKVLLPFNLRLISPGLARFCSPR